VKISAKEARRLLDALAHLRRALKIAETSKLDEVKQLAMERCIEIADEALQSESSYAAANFEKSLILSLSKLRYLLGRDYHIVDPIAVRDTVLEVFPKLIRKIESHEDMLQKSAELKSLPRRKKGA
jgi:uncharacterized protein with HEPN domain